MPHCPQLPKGDRGALGSSLLLLPFSVAQAFGPATGGVLARCFPPKEILSCFAFWEGSDPGSVIMRVPSDANPPPTPRWDVSPSPGAQ